MCHAYLLKVLINSVSDISAFLLCERGIVLRIDGLMYQRHELALKLLHGLSTHVYSTSGCVSHHHLVVLQYMYTRLIGVSCNMYLQGWCHGLGINVQLEQRLLFVMTSAFQAPR